MLLLSDVTDSYTRLNEIKSQSHKEEIQHFHVLKHPASRPPLSWTSSSAGGRPRWLSSHCSPQDVWDSAQGCWLRSLCVSEGKHNPACPFLAALTILLWPKQHAPPKEPTLFRGSAYGLRGSCFKHAGFFLADSSWEGWKEPVRLVSLSQLESSNPDCSDGC